MKNYVSVLAMQEKQSHTRPSEEREKETGSVLLENDPPTHRKIFRERLVFLKKATQVLQQNESGQAL